MMNPQTTLLSEYRQKVIEELGVSPSVLEMEDGWAPLIYGLFIKMKEKNPDWNPKDIVQVKQKFGGLRVYLDRSMTEEEALLLQTAEFEALHTCEICGGDGTQGSLNGYWIMVVCQPCVQEYAEKSEKNKK